MVELSKRIMFNDGYVLDKKHIYLASQLQKYANHDRSRISVIIENEWKYADFDDAVLSVACIHNNNLSFFMGHNGNILVGGLGKPVVENIPDIKNYGNILRIRNIADKLYICGMSGQIYRREPSGWVHIEGDLLGTKLLDFEDIGGTSDDDIYAVGTRGEVYHYNGTRWTKVDFPTNRPLSGVKCISENEVYVCGDNGIIYRGSSDHWDFIGDTTIEHNFWAVEKYKDNVYLSYDGGLMLYDGYKLTDVDFGLTEDFDGHRLHANDGVLWSFGIDSLLYYNGKKWTHVVCPMNV